MARRGPGCGCFGFGCGGGLAVLALLGALAWFMVIKPAKEFVASWQAPPAQTQTLPQATGNVNAPLNTDDVQKFVRIRRQVRRALGTSFTSLQGLLNDMNAGQNPSMTQVLGVLKDTTASVGQGRAAMNAGLVAEKMSPERYAVIRSGVNRALGVPNINFAQVATSLQNGQLPDLNKDVQTATPQERQLVKPFEEELRMTVAAGLLGL